MLSAFHEFNLQTESCYYKFRFLVQQIVCVGALDWQKGPDRIWWWYMYEIINISCAFINMEETVLCVCAQLHYLTYSKAKGDGILSLEFLVWLLSLKRKSFRHDMLQLHTMLQCEAICKKWKVANMICSTRFRGNFSCFFPRPFAVNLNQRRTSSNLTEYGNPPKHNNLLPFPLLFLCGNTRTMAMPVQTNGARIGTGEKLMHACLSSWEIRVCCDGDR